MNTVMIQKHASVPRVITNSQKVIPTGWHLKVTPIHGFVIILWIIFQKHQHLVDIVKSFRMYPNGTFLFDPTEDDTLIDCYIDSHIKFENQTKACPLSSS